MSTVTRSWSPAAWAAINELAELDLATYPHHVRDREGFLGKARARRVERHGSDIDRLLAVEPDIDSAAIVATLSPPAVTARREPNEASRRDYDRVIRCCGVCDSNGLVPVVVEGVERWAPCGTCGRDSR